ncbi:MAG: hypothetical protein Q8M74_06675 [Chloroflexota bacterium]|nr:hypothetical protein [Chloroflexota bacterium]
MTAAAAPSRGVDPGAADARAVPIAFGPVRSRRLGWSLGQIVSAVRERLADCREAGQPIDYATFVPDGEPTLDRHLGEAIRGFSALGLAVAVITLRGLAWSTEIRDALAAADWRSLKRDTVGDGMRRLTDHYRGELATETMIVAGLNDQEPAIESTAAFAGALEPTRADVPIPTRPPAEPSVRVPEPAVVRRATDLFRAVEARRRALVRTWRNRSPLSANPGRGCSGSWPCTRWPSRRPAPTWPGREPTSRWPRRWSTPAGSSGLSSTGRPTCGTQV